MAEFTYNPVQLIAAGASAIFNTARGCPRGCVLHRNESGVITLRGGARYQVTFNGNIALPEGATVGPISTSISIEGEGLPTSNGIVTPAAVDEYFNVTSTAIIDVPRGCCSHIGVKNTSSVSINMQNANLTITRIL